MALSLFNLLIIDFIFKIVVIFKATAIYFNLIV